MWVTTGSVSLKFKVKPPTHQAHPHPSTGTPYQHSGTMGGPIRPVESTFVIIASINILIISKTISIYNDIEISIIAGAPQKRLFQQFMTHPMTQMACQLQTEA